MPVIQKASICEMGMARGRRICKVRRDFLGIGFAKRGGCCGAGLSRERAPGNGRSLATGRVGEPRRVDGPLRSVWICRATRALSREQMAPQDVRGEETNLTNNRHYTCQWES